MKLLRASDHKRMPWKNGGGETVEITVSPAGVALADFDWRVSMGTVATDGPFSFPDGADGHGIEPVLLSIASEPLAFSGLCELNTDKVLRFARVPTDDS